jgi:hypothetical protein
MKIIYSREEIVRMKKRSKPQLTVVKPSSATTTTQPPRKLGNHGQSLWASVIAEYDIVERGCIEILVQGCLALDRAEECAAQIDEEGPTIMTKNGMREHPLLKMELQNRAFVCRSLARLGLNLEVVKPIGRPGRPL